MSELVAWIARCGESGIDQGEVCVLARTNDTVRAAAEALRKLGLPVVTLARKTADDRGKPGVRIGTMHRAKGLELAAIALINVSDGFIPPRWLLDAAPDAAIRRSLVDAERALLHVSATRAKKRLLILSVGRISELLPDPLSKAA